MPLVISSLRGRHTHTHTHTHKHTHTHAHAYIYTQLIKTIPRKQACTGYRPVRTWLKYYIKLINFKSLAI